MENKYQIAKEMYKEIGVNTDAAIRALQDVKISINCWQGDDINGFLFDNDLSGGIQVTGNYSGRARNAEELRQDLEFALSLIPGKHKINLHSIYADTDEKIDLDEIEPRHFEKWVDWAKKNNLGLDFNPTCFAHQNADSGFTLSSNNEEIRAFWVKHCKKSRLIGEYFGKALNQKSVVNIWIPDGYKDIPVDRLSPRLRLQKSLDEIFADKLDEKHVLDAVESKLFGIGAEAYTVGTNEFYFGYAVKNNKAICLDAGHFHPTEIISDKISSTLLFTNELLLHVSRPMRWDSDHVVILDDELHRVSESLIRNDLIKRTHIGLDFFDASINRIAAWVIGTRSLQKALLKAFLEPTPLLKNLENEGNFTSRLAILEELKTFPFGAVYDHYCEKENIDVNMKWLEAIYNYEKSFFQERK